MFLTEDSGSCRDEECFISFLSLLYQITKITIASRVSPTKITTTATPAPIAGNALLSSPSELSTEETTAWCNDA